MSKRQKIDPRGITDEGGTGNQARCAQDNVPTWQPPRLLRQQLFESARDDRVRLFTSLLRKNRTKNIGAGATDINFQYRTKVAGEGGSNLWPWYWCADKSNAVKYCWEAPPGIEPETGDTLLMITMKTGKEELARRLIEHQAADLGIRNSSGRDAASVAKGSGRELLYFRLLTCHHCNLRPRRVVLEGSKGPRIARLRSRSHAHPISSRPLMVRNYGTSESTSSGDDLSCVSKTTPPQDTVVHNAENGIKNRADPQRGGEAGEDCRSKCKSSDDVIPSESSIRVPTDEGIKPDSRFMVKNVHPDAKLPDGTDDGSKEGMPIPETATPPISGGVRQPLNDRKTVGVQTDTALMAPQTPMLVDLTQDTDDVIAFGLRALKQHHKSHPQTRSVAVGNDRPIALASWFRESAVGNKDTGRAPSNEEKSLDDMPPAIGVKIYYENEIGSKQALLSKFSGNAKKDSRQDEEGNAVREDPKKPCGKDGILAIAEEAPSDAARLVTNRTKVDEVTLELQEIFRQDAIQKDGKLDYGDTFDVFDVDGDGNVTADELYSIFVRLGMRKLLPEEGILRIVARVPTNVSGRITLRELQIFVDRPQSFPWALLEEPVGGTIVRKGNGNNEEAARIVVMLHELQVNYASSAEGIIKWKKTSTDHSDVSLFVRITCGDRIVESTVTNSHKLPEGSRDYSNHSQNTGANSDREVWSWQWDQIVGNETAGPVNDQGGKIGEGNELLAKVKATTTNNCAADTDTLGSDDVVQTTASANRNFHFERNMLWIPVRGLQKRSQQVKRDSTGGKHGTPADSKEYPQVEDDSSAGDITSGSRAEESEDDEVKSPSGSNFSKLEKDPKIAEHVMVAPQISEKEDNNVAAGKPCGDDNGTTAAFWRFRSKKSSFRSREKSRRKLKKISKRVSFNDEHDKHFGRKGSACSDTDGSVGGVTFSKAARVDKHDGAKPSNKPHSSTPEKESTTPETSVSRPQTSARRGFAAIDDELTDSNEDDATAVSGSSQNKGRLLWHLVKEHRKCDEAGKNNPFGRKYGRGAKRDHHANACDNLRVKPAPEDEKNSSETSSNSANSRRFHKKKGLFWSPGRGHRKRTEVVKHDSFGDKRGNHMGADESVQADGDGSAGGDLSVSTGGLDELGDIESSSDSDFDKQTKNSTTSPKDGNAITASESVLRKGGSFWSPGRGRRKRHGVVKHDSYGEKIETSGGDRPDCDGTTGAEDERDDVDSSNDSEFTEQKECSTSTPGVPRRGGSPWSTGRGHIKKHMVKYDPSGDKCNRHMGESDGGHRDGSAGDGPSALAGGLNKLSGAESSSGSGFEKEKKFSRTVPGDSESVNASEVFGRERSSFWSAGKGRRKRKEIFKHDLFCDQRGDHMEASSGGQIDCEGSVGDGILFSATGGEDEHDDVELSGEPDFTEPNKNSQHAPGEIDTVTASKSFFGNGSSFWSSAKRRQKRSEIAEQNSFDDKGDIGIKNGCHPDTDGHGGQDGTSRTISRPLLSDSKYSAASDTILLEIWELKSSSMIHTPNQRLEEENNCDSTLFEAIKEDEDIPDSAKLVGSEYIAATTETSLQIATAEAVQRDDPVHAATTTDVHELEQVPPREVCENLGSVESGVLSQEECVDEKKKGSMEDEPSTELVGRRKSSLFLSPFKGRQKHKSPSVADKTRKPGSQTASVVLLNPEIKLGDKKEVEKHNSKITNKSKDYLNSRRRVQPRSPGGKAAAQNQVLWGQLKMSAADVLSMTARETTTAEEVEIHTQHLPMAVFDKTKGRSGRFRARPFTGEISRTERVVLRNKMTRGGYVDVNGDGDIGVQNSVETFPPSVVDDWFEVGYSNGKRGKTKGMLHLTISCIGIYAAADGKK